MAKQATFPWWGPCAGQGYYRLVTTYGSREPHWCLWGLLPYITRRPYSFLPITIKLALQPLLTVYLFTHHIAAILLWQPCLEVKTTVRKRLGHVSVRSEFGDPYERIPAFWLLGHNAVNDCLWGAHYRFKVMTNTQGMGLSFFSFQAGTYLPSHGLHQPWLY